jgi:hypothetical protein
MFFLPHEFVSHHQNPTQTLNFYSIPKGTTHILQPHQKEGKLKSGEMV